MKRVLSILVGLTWALGQPTVACATDFHWINASGGAWSEPSNWSPPGPPTLDDRALLDLSGTYTVLVDSAEVEARATIVGATSGTQTLRLEYATLDVQDSVTILAHGRLESVHSTANGPLTRSQGSMVLTDAQFAGQIVNLGMILIHGSVSADSVVSAAGAVIRLEQLASDYPNFSMTSLDNAGSIQLVVPGSFFAVILDGGNPFSNRTTGTIECLGNGTGIVNVSGRMVNDGSVVLRSLVELDSGTAGIPLINYGTLQTEPGSNVYLNGEGFINDGLLELSGFNSARSIENHGTVRLSDFSAQLVLDQYVQTISGATELFVREQYPGPAPTVAAHNTAQFAGALHVRIQDDYVPQPGDSLDVFNYGTHVGTFDSIELLGASVPNIAPLYGDSALYLIATGPHASAVPNTGGNGGTVSIALYGSGIGDATGMRLRGAAKADIVGAIPILDPPPGAIRSTFDLAEVPLGSRDIVVERAGHPDSVFTDLFTIVEADSQPVTIQVLGRSAIARGREQVYALVLDNPSNFDAHGGVVVDLPEAMDWEVSVRRSPGAKASVMRGSANNVARLYLPDMVIPPGTSSEIGVRLKSPLDGTAVLAPLQARWY